MNLVFPRAMSAILYSCPPLQESKELLYFPIKPSRRKSKTVDCFETSIFEKGLNGKHFLALAKLSTSWSTGSPSQVMNYVCVHSD